MKGGITKKGKYFYCWYPDGKGGKHWIRKYTDGLKMDSESMAKRMLNKIQISVDENRGKFDPSLFGLDKSLLIENAWETYQKEKPVGMLRTKQRESIFRIHILPHFEGQSIREIRKIDISNWVNDLRDKGMSPAYLRIVKGTLRAFLWAMCDKEGDMPIFPSITVDSKTPEWMTLKEQMEVMEFIPECHKAIVRFIMTFGLRSIEACNLRWNDIDWQKKTILFSKRKAHNDNTLPITAGVEGILKAPHPVRHIEYVFCTPKGQKYTRYILHYFWEEANKKANQKYGTKIVPFRNATRHSLISQLCNEGVSPHEAASITGNSVRVVTKHYMAISMETKRRLLEKRGKYREAREG